ncbi:MAG: PAS domain S-box protein [Candidatus Palauibacterales bacterium]|nr:PAS domain S-box protein [Candidatus Palauibacterales bacterium]
MVPMTTGDEPLSILLIEDNPGDARIFEELLAESGLDADHRWVRSLEAGLKALDDYEADVVVADLGLPDSEGMNTVHRIARTGVSVPVVVLTGQADEGNVRAALAAGASEYLPKDGLEAMLLARTLLLAVERHRLEGEAERQRELSRSILESVPEHIAVLDADGVIVATNEAWRRFAATQGGDPRGYVGESYLEETRTAAEKGNEDAGEMLAGILSVLRGDSDQFELEYPCHGPDEERWFRVSVVPLRERGRSGVVVSHVNITDRRVAEREVRRRGQRFEALVSNLSDVISVVGPDATILYESPSVERVLGYEPEELEGENALEYFHPEDRERVRHALVETAAAPDEERTAEARFRHADGSWRVVEARGRTPPAETDLHGVIVVTRDVTDRVRREQELEEATSSLRERVKEQSCLYDVSQLLHADDRDLDARLQDVVDRLPEGWKYPAVTAARLELRDEVWSTAGFSETGDALEAPIELDGERAGRIEVRYVEERPEADVGPFISEEKRLLEAIAHQVALAVDRRRTRGELEAERSRLAEVFRKAPSFLATVRGPDHVYEMANPAYYELVGDRDLVGRPVREALPEVVGSGYVDLLNHVLETGETVEREERPLELASEDGGTVLKFVSFVYQPLREADEVVGVIVHGVDVTEQVQRRQEAEDREETLSKVLSTSADGVLLADVDGEFTYANPAAEEMLGLEESEIAGRSYRDPAWGITDPEGGEFPDEELPVARVLRTGEPVERVEHGVQRPDGARRVLSVNAAPLYGSDGKVQGVVASLRDVTEQRERRQALEESEARYRTLVETMAEATLTLDADGHITFANAAAEEMLGLEESELASRTYNDPTWRITAADGGALPDQELPFRRVMETGRPVRNAEHGIERPDGERRILAVNAAPLGDGAGEPAGVVATIRDITDRKTMEQELRHRALHDVLTGLANRSLFRDRMEQAMAASDRSDEPVGLLVLDLDRFKQVNDHLGHTAGDRLLEEVARRLEAAVRGEDTVARIGGDEFAVIVTGAGGEQGIRRVVDRLVGSLTRPYTVGGEEVELDVTVGGVLACGCDLEAAVDGQDLEDVVRYADLALYQAKARGGSSFHLFHPEQDRERTRQLGREQELRRAIRNEEFEVHYQPVIRLRDGTVWGVEPLVRWRHPDRGMVSPSEFIPVAEETGLIHELGNLLFRQASRDAASWPSTNGHPLTVTPNISGRQFERDDLVRDLVAIAREAGVDPSRYDLEVTESAITRATGKIEELRSHGFGIFVDDFGTGYSSFHYLRDLDLDGLKIDMSFVQGLDRSRKGRGLVETMVTLGRTLEMTVVAEGIETDGQREALEEMTCPLGQGFLFTRPMTSGELVDYLNGSRGGSDR